MKAMKILLISPHIGVKKNRLSKFTNYQNLALQQIAALTPDKHEVELINEINKKIDFEEECDIVGISCFTSNSLRGYEIADKFRKREIIVVFGGYHPTALPYEAKQHADSVVVGEAEGTWPQLLIDFENGKLKPFYYQINPVDPRLIPTAKRFNQNKIRNSAIQATRGCPINCEFCAMHLVEGTKFRGRPINNVIEEIQSIKSRGLFFVDASLTINPGYTKALFKEMKGLDKKFSCFGNINVLAKDDELLKLAYEAGCKKWFIGFESVSQETINSINKKTNKIDEYDIAIKKIKNHGMMITGLFMYGFDNDTPKVFNQTLQVLSELHLDSASFSIVTPYPGTYLFKKLDKEGRILTRDWSKYNEGNVVFTPKNMSEKILFQGVKKASMNYYSFSNSFKRCFLKNNSNLSQIRKNFFENFIVSREFYKDLFNY
jgi:radical SAM superfamily enzyme YgiQ (UPF0313 family)